MAALPPNLRTVPALLRRGSEQFADHTLLIAGDTRWTFTDALRHAQGYAGRLRAAGIRPGDRVALLCSNRAEFLQVVLGCAWAGAVVVPVNTASRGDQLRHILANSGAVLVVAEPDPARNVDALGPTTAQRWLVGAGVAGWAPFPPPADPVDPHPSGPATPSRSSTPPAPRGRRRGCAARTRSISGGACTPRACSASARATCSPTSLPLFHTNALNTFFQALLAGATIAVVPRFSASGFWGQLAEHEATVTYVLGAMVPILLSRPPGPTPTAPTASGSPWRPAVPGDLQARFTERTGIAPARRLRLHRDQLRHRRAGGAAAAGQHGAGAARLLRRGSSTPTTTGCRTATAGRAGPARRRAVRLRHRLLRHAGEDRRGVAQPVVPHRRPRDPRRVRPVPLHRPHEGRDPPPRREHLLLSRSSRCCSAIPRSPPSRPFRPAPTSPRTR